MSEESSNKAAAGSWLCACGTRNRRKHELCVRCGEPAPPKEEATEAAPAASDDEKPPTTGVSQWLLIAGILAVGVGVAASIPGLPREDVRVARAPWANPTRSADTVPVVQARPRPEESAFEQGRRLLARGDAKGAVPFLARAAQEMPERADVHNLYAHALWQTNARPAALAEFHSAVVLAPTLSSLALDEARALAIQGPLGKSAEAYRELVARDPTNVEALHEAALVATKQNAPADAEKWLRMALALRPNDTALQQDLGFALESAGNGGEAATLFGSVLERDPRNALVRTHLASVLQEQGSSSEAIALVRTQAVKEPNNATLHRALGSLLERAGRQEEAAVEYKAYLRLTVAGSADAQTIRKRAEALEKQAASLSRSSS